VLPGGEHHRSPWGHTETGPRNRGLRDANVHLTGVGYSFGELLTVDDLNISKVQARRARRKSPGLAVTDKGHLTANGADVTVSSATISSEDFRWGGLSLPFTIPAGHSVPFTITFVPKDRLSSSATLSFASDAKNSPTEQVVTARRVDPVGHKVQLSWKASTSKHLAGYNVYRGTRSGGPYKKINSSLDPSTKYTDLHVVAGYKYHYVATAVSLKGQESKRSKQVEAVIP